MFATFFVIGVSGCQDLAVENTNSPDRSIAFARTGDVVSVISGTFGEYWFANQDCTGAMLYSTIADEMSCSWGNFGMRDLSSEPRVAWNNSSTYGINSLSTTGPWYRSYRGISNANDGLRAIAAAEEEGSVDDNAFTRSEDESANDTNRLKAFAKMSSGMMHATLALIFDRAFVVDETVDLENDELELRSYQEVATEAIRILDEARAIAASNDFLISAEEDWIFGLDVSSADMVKLINSFVARVMVQMPRTVTEREAVNWSEVMSRIDNGITADFAPVGDTDGDDGEWDCLKYYGQEGTTWARADYRTIGPADEDGSYDAWLATPVQDRNRFDIVTSDRRIVGDPLDVSVDGTDFEWHISGGRFPAARGTYHWSSHNHKRYQHYYNGDANGAMPHMLVTEMDLYTAEALLRTGGSTEEVARLLNKTRVNRGALNPAMGSDPVGNVSDSQSHLDSASLWAKLKHERRIETFNTAGGLAHFDDRGLGDLVEGTPLHFPIPGAELETLGMGNYTFGGVGGTDAAPGGPAGRAFQNLDDLRASSN